MQRLTDCVLRAGGKKFDVDEYMALCSIRNVIVAKRGDKRINRINANSGITIFISNHKHVKTQAKDILLFLINNRGDLMRLKDCKGVDYFFLDFGVLVSEGVLSQSTLIPADLIKAISEFNIGITISYYLTC